ncbi:HU family DNA-binding protein [Candidatus Gracilibacteria bacterium]|nr:HU family DNA-binding protein [Candidatus Gracilibacteria bacterium]
MTKTELIAAIAEKANITKKDAGEAVNAFVEVVTSELASGGKIALTGFGTFEVAEMAARNGVNPKTGEKIKIAAMKRPKFKSGKTFKDAIRNS